MAQMTNPLSNLSYTNKDFQTIYPEMLDLVKKLTYRWDPSISNESDPGVILLKLNALIADKNNYNIDKNILECFPVSVTQDRNARQIFEQLGYNMKWYISATTSISMKYIGKSIENRTSVSIPAFTMITDDEGSVVYTTLTPVALPISSSIQTVDIIQGIVNDYELNGSNTITAENLDSNHRLYFNEKNIAQNGIYIFSAADSTYSSESSWKRVDTLTTQQLGQKLFKFGIDPTTDTCFIELPADAEILIGEGIVIKYITTNGIDGNISANVLDRFYDVVKDENIELNTDNVRIWNPSSAANGYDPESISSAYSNYQKTVGTFDTIVTLRDYFNAIVNGRYASNGIVCDRTNDIQSCYKVISQDKGLESKKVIIDQEAGKPVLSAFDLKLYLLQYSDNFTNADGYNKSFTMMNGNNPENDDAYYDLRIGLSLLKSIQHNYAEIKPTVPCVFKNKYPINCKVIPQYQVTQEQSTKIIDNVKKALYENFNSRKVDFGYEVKYEDVYNVILNADERIKAIILEDFDYTTYYVYWDAGSFKEKLLSSDLDTQNKIYAKSALAGITPPLDIDRNFRYILSRKYSAKYNNIYSLQTEVPIKISANTSYTVKANEQIQFFAQSFVDDIQYTTGCKYQFADSDKNIPENSDYKLNGELKLSWVDENKNSHIATYPASTYIKLNFKLKPDKVQGTLSSTQTITIRKPNTQQLNATSSPYCYWILNNQVIEGGNAYYQLFDGTEATPSRMLEAGEYFLYTDKDFSYLGIFGSGTVISATDVTSPMKVSATVDYTNINENGVKAFNESDWYLLTSQTITAQEMRYEIASEGQTVTVDDTAEVELNNTLKNVTNPSIGGNQLEGISSGWQARSVLLLNCSPYTPQQLTGGQKVTFNYLDGVTQRSATIQGRYIQPSAIISGAGGGEINTILYDASGNPQYLSVAIYDTDSTTNLDNDSNLKISLNNGLKSVNQELNLPDTDEHHYYMMKVELPFAGDNVTWSITAAEGTAGTVESISGSSLSNLSAGFYWLRVRGSSNTVTLTFNLPSTASAAENLTILLSPAYVFSVNPDYTSNLALINSLGKGYYDWSYDVPEEVKINNPMLPKSFFDSSHIFNKATIAQIDTSNMNISVINSTR